RRRGYYRWSRSLRLHAARRPACLEEQRCRSRKGAVPLHPGCGGWAARGATADESARGSRAAPASRLGDPGTEPPLKCRQKDNVMARRSDADRINGRRPASGCLPPESRKGVSFRRVAVPRLERRRGGSRMLLVVLDPVHALRRPRGRLDDRCPRGHRPEAAKSGRLTISPAFGRAALPLVVLCLLVLGVFAP